MEFPLEEIMCFVVGYVITAIVGYTALKIAEKYNWGLARVFKNLPNWTGIIVFVLILSCAPFFCYGLTWGFVSYNYLKDGRFDLALISFLINIFGCFYTAIMIKDVPRRTK